MSYQNGFQVRRDESDKFIAAVTDGILMRGGIQVDKPEPGANDFRGMTLRSLAVECAIKNGVSNAYRMDEETLYRQALSPDSQFSSILSNAANKTLAIEYQAVNTSFQLWTRKGSNPNFKPSVRYQISEAGNLEKLTQSGELKFDEMQDQGVQTSLATFGRSWGISRQSIINDDINLITKIPSRYARASARGINRLVYMQLGQNAKIFDGQPLFHESHLNLAQSGGAINTTSVGAGRASMRKQKGLRGIETLNISPTFLIVPAEREVEALRFVNSTADPDSNNSRVINIYNKKLQVISDADLDDFSPYAWYMAADPFELDTIEVTYLNGNEIPTIESQPQFDTLGIKFRIYMDYGVTVLDYRGLYKNSGM